MDYFAIPFILYLLALLPGLFVILLLLELVLGPQHRPNEPPLVSQNIPFIGHFLGFFLHGTQYFNTTSSKLDSPTYTINVLWKKFYISTEPRMILSIRSLDDLRSLNPFAFEGSLHFIYVEGDCRTVVGPPLEKANQSVLEQSARYLKGNRSELQGQLVQLLAWIRSFVVRCSTDSLYGKANPIRLNPDLEEALLHFELDMSLLLINIAPAFLAWKGYRARARLVEGFISYFSRSPLSWNSPLTKTRYNYITQYYKEPPRVVAQHEVWMLMNTFGNVVPSIFYMLYYIFSNESLLQDVRTEIEACVDKQAVRGPKLCLDVTKVRKCLLLTSVLLEVNRLHSRGVESRLVMNDIFIGPKYSFVEDSIAITPASAVIHKSPEWDPPDFDGFRFLKKARAEWNLPALYDWRSTVKPARYFGTTEILVLVIMLVYQYKIQPDLGEWRLPVELQPSARANMHPPRQDIPVRITRREGLEEIDWVFSGR